MRDLDYYESACTGCRWEYSRNEHKPCKACLRYTEDEEHDDKYTGKDPEERR